MSIPSRRRGEGAHPITDWKDGCVQYFELLHILVEDRSEDDLQLLVLSCRHSTLLTKLFAHEAAAAVCSCFKLAIRCKEWCTRCLRLKQTCEH